MIESFYGTLTGTTNTGQSGLGVMAMHMYSAFSKGPELEPHHLMQFCVIPSTIRRGAYPSAKMQSVYSTAPNDRVVVGFNFIPIIFYPFLWGAVEEADICINGYKVSLALHYNYIYLRWLVLFYGISTLSRSFNAELSHFHKSQTEQFFVYTQLNVKTVNSKQFSLLWLHSLVLFDP